MQKLRTIPFYLILLPLFYVLHGFNENFGFIKPGEAFLLCLSYLLYTAITFALSWLIFRNKTKAAIFAVVIMSIYLFFGAVYDFTHQHMHAIGRYRFLLSAIIVILVVLFVYLWRTKNSFVKFTFFLNFLLLLYIVIDTGSIIAKSLQPATNKYAVYDFAKKTDYKYCNTCAKPNMYLLLFDEYNNSYALKEKYQFTNDLDAYLIENGFKIQTHSRSNYNFTCFSMPSLLNMSYLKGISNVDNVIAEDFANAGTLTRNSEIIKFLSVQGYDFVNYSIFDFAGHPTMVRESFLPLNTRLISDNTISSRIQNDMGHLFMHRFPFSLFTKDAFYLHRNTNEKFIQLVKNQATIKSEKPKFVYAHFNMPHVPFYYDRKGNLKDVSTITKEKLNPTIEAYLDYLVYTNTRIKDIINTIQQKDPSAVIILMSDHGFRIPKAEESPGYPHHFFQNLNAVYFPNKNYSALYDSVSNVNQFRIIFNTLFGQQFPLLKDSSVLLRTKSNVDE